MNDIFYGNAPLQIYDIVTEKTKLNDINPTFLCHCCMGHINEKHIMMLHNDGLLSSFDFESYDTCESCLLGKMIKAPFTGVIEMT